MVSGVFRRSKALIVRRVGRNHGLEQHSRDSESDLVDLDYALV